ncbi:MAG TPA: GSCFA domain protein, partial [Paludibacteraceae bacterium]|nr:GSCFA domain protein [Paludibacteraceae bacterium]
SETAINYIWEKFSDTYFSEKTKQIKQRLEMLREKMNHRPLHPNSPEYVSFLQQIELEKNNILNEYPFLKERIKDVNSRN